VDRDAHQLAHAMSDAVRVAVVGAGWAGLAAAVHATTGGARVTLFEMAPQPGGRARSTPVDGLPRDNGQHILVGAYTETLALMRQVGADPDGTLLRLPLTLLDARGRGLRGRPGPAALSFARAVWGCGHWPVSTRLAVLRRALAWRLGGFRAAPGQTVATLLDGLPAPACDELFEPLCVAALNTPAADADAQVFLRVLHDALFAGPGSADLLLPRLPLQGLLPTPAIDWLRTHGADVRAGQRVQQVTPAGTGWRVDGDTFDTVVLACAPRESARLARAAAPDWARRCEALPYEPIVTVWLAADGVARWPAPMLALPTGPDAPAQYAFDLGALTGEAGLYSFVISGAADAVAAGAAATADTVQRQATRALAPLGWPAGAAVRHVAMEKRATFRCVPGLSRPPAQVAPGLWAAGDHVDGPYPATLEGAVRSGRAAARALLAAHRHPAAA
jgi:hydroxysqualene dehydroxylase